MKLPKWFLELERPTVAGALLGTTSFEQVHKQDLARLLNLVRKAAEMAEWQISASVRDHNYYSREKASEFLALLEEKGDE